MPMYNYAYTLHSIMPCSIPNIIPIYSVIPCDIASTAPSIIHISTYT